MVFFFLGGDGICDLALDVSYICCSDGGDCLKWGFATDADGIWADDMCPYCPFRTQLIFNIAPSTECSSFCIKRFSNW